MCGHPLSPKCWIGYYATWQQGLIKDASTLLFHGDAVPAPKEHGRRLLKDRRPKSGFPFFEALNVGPHIGQFIYKRVGVQNGPPNLHRSFP
jgi:hypothetical protein